MLRDMTSETTLQHAAPTPDGSTAAPLAAAQEQFVRIWGQMGSNWGIARTMAEVHALLFATGRPLNTDQIMEYLAISRGNASMTLRALLEWGVIHKVHQPGDRKEYFEAEQDVWVLFRTITRHRIQREVAPVIDSLHRCREQLGTEEATEAAFRARLEAMLQFLEMIEQIGRSLTEPQGQGLQQAAMLMMQSFAPESGRSPESTEGAEGADDE